MDALLNFYPLIIVATTIANIILFTLYKIQLDRSREFEKRIDDLNKQIKDLEKAPKREDSYDLKDFLHDQLTYNASMIEIKVVDPKTIYKRSVRDV